MDQEINKQNSDVALIKTYEGMYCYSYKPLKPTGRWKINGKKLKINAFIEGSVNPEQAMKNYINRKKNSWEWLGVEIIGITPLGQKIRFVYES